MSAHVLEPLTELPVGRPQLVLVPTGREAVRAAQAARPRMRLTTLGRFVVSFIVAAVLVLLAVGFAGQFASASGEPHSITVKSGQTLSEIAARELPDLAITDGVLELQLANGLSSTQIHAGQTLLVPAG